MASDYRVAEFSGWIPRHGAHIFHTNSKKIWDYVNEHVPFRPYTHTVKVEAKSWLLPLPINLDTLEMVYGVKGEVACRQAVLNDIPTRISRPSFESACQAKIGRTLYQLMVKGYTEKVWGYPAAALRESMAGRIQIRYDRSTHYFEDTYQGLPTSYTDLWTSLLDGVSIGLEHDYKASYMNRYDLIIFTGSVDTLLIAHGLIEPVAILPFRGSRFITEIKPVDPIHPGTINFADPLNLRLRQFDWTKFGSYSETRGPITTEWPDQYVSEPSHPIHTEESLLKFQHYVGIAKAHFGKKLILGGRMGQFAYWDMDQTIGSALTTMASVV